MKANYTTIVAAVFCYGFVTALPAGAQITGINPAVSTAVINFFDNNSFIGVNPGGIYTQTNFLWTGSAYTSSQTDPTTLDYATGTISASGAGTSYNINLNNITLTQPVGNTGYADLFFKFTVDFNIGPGGLASLPTSFPNFLASGTVQTGGSGYAYIFGNITYSGVDISGGFGLLDTVTYNWFYNTPGPFANILVTGTPTSGTTPALMPNTIFEVKGEITIEVDPASIDINILEEVPEPTTLALAGMGVAGLMVARRRKV